MKKISRSTSNRKVAGVLGGLADYLGMDATLLRILFVIGLFASFGFFLVIYIICIFLVPNETDVMR